MDNSMETGNNTINISLQSDPVSPYANVLKLEFKDISSY